MTTTTADKGEQECREAFEKWAITQEWIAPVKNHEPFSRECYPDGDYDVTAVRAAWSAWNRRPTNEGQEGLTDSEILTDAHRYCCKYVHADDAPYRFTERGIIEFVKLRIARHLSSHPAPDDQQAKDAARILGMLRDLTDAAEGMAEANNDGSCDYIIKCSYELLAALSTTKQARHEVEN